MKNQRGQKWHKLKKIIENKLNFLPEILNCKMTYVTIELKKECNNVETD